MIEFRSPQLTDREWLLPLLLGENCMASQYNFANLYLWSRAFGQVIARYEDRLLMRSRYHKKDGCYAYPVGTGPLGPALDLLSADAKEYGAELTLLGVSGRQKERLEEEFPGRFCFREDRDNWDYIYDIDRLADLGGKKLHAKRNHIHRFDDAYPDWLFEPIGRENLAECIAVGEAWAAEHHGDGGTDTLHEETVALIEALYQMKTLEAEGGLIRAGGQVVAFSLGTFTTPECFDVHFEKAKKDIQGAYAVINRETARMVREKYPQVRWINREDDLGLEGLRKAKLSYYPDLMLEKFSAVER